eukprot:m.15126 g.15126  ORF g.15126 m.15126 type:complete len:93 (+) comp5297_c0_seq1:248-526(+)
MDYLAKKALQSQMKSTTNNLKGSLGLNDKPDPEKNSQAAEEEAKARERSQAALAKKQEKRAAERASKRDEIRAKYANKGAKPKKSDGDCTVM